MSDEGRRFGDALERLAGDLARPLLLAVSGGPDSMAMLTLAAEAQEAAGGGVIAATVDHRLRTEAADEAAMVAAHCATLGIGHATLSPDRPVSGPSIQAQARAARYALLADHARATGAGAIVTAHHADDQAETFLMRAARGSGLAGLAGVRTRTVIEGLPVLRPLLDWRRAELRAIVRRGEVPFVDDPSNTDLRHDRTRFRQLLGANEWLDPPHLARSAAALADADADLRATVDWIWDAHAQVAEDEVRIATGKLPRELLRRLARRAIGVVHAAAALDAAGWSESANIERMLDALAAGKRTTQAGVIVSIRSGVWRFRAAPPRRTAPE